MTAEVCEGYAGWCDPCGWEGEFRDSRYEAERDVEAHNDKHHADEDEEAESPNLTPREEFQALLDDLVEVVRGR